MLNRSFFEAILPGYFDTIGIKKAETDICWQKFNTPSDVIHDMLDQYEFKISDKILILFNREFIPELIKRDGILEKNIYFVADRISDADFISKYNKNVNVVCLNDKNKINDIDYLDSKIKEFNVKQFDIVFSNPPYNDNIDLKILQSMFNIATNIVFIHPSTYLLDKKFKTKIYNEVRNTNHLEKTILIWGNYMFNIKLFCPLCISVWNTNKTTLECEVIDNAFIRWTNNNSNYTCDINDISIHGELFQKVKHFLNCKNNLLNNITDENDLTDYSVALPLIRGGQEYGKGVYSHFYSILGLNYNSYKCNHTFRFSNHVGKEQRLHYGFNSEEERNNFINYCKTKVVRFLLSLIKTNANLARGELAVIPWLDFTQEWDDLKLCKYFQINQELWDYIDKFIPDYYDVYDSGFNRRTCQAKTVIKTHYGPEPNEEMKNFCPPEVIDYLMKTDITAKSSFISKTFNDYIATKYKSKNSDTLSWRVTDSIWSIRLANFMNVDNTDNQIDISMKDEKEETVKMPPKKKRQASIAISAHKGLEPNEEMKKLCPYFVLDYLMKTDITAKSDFVSKSFKDSSDTIYRAFKMKAKNSNEFVWRVMKYCK